MRQSPRIMQNEGHNGKRHSGRKKSANDDKGIIARRNTGNECEPDRSELIQPCKRNRNLDLNICKIEDQKALSEDWHSLAKCMNLLFRAG